MRINELVGYKQNPAMKAAQDFSDERWGDSNTAINKFIDSLKKMGYELEHMGSGMYANVFKRPNDPYVIKIFSQDTGYLKYVQYCLQHQDNPHVPKFRGKIIRISGDTYAVRIEVLQPYQQGINYEADYAAHQLIQYDTMFGGLAQHPDIEAYSPELKQLFVDLANLFGATTLTDLHKTNIMMRGNTLVITDPVG